MEKTEKSIGYEPVGSFQRPKGLRVARKMFSDGVLSYEKLREKEDDYIRELIRIEEELGFSHIVDGEFRKTYWHLDFIWQLDGITEIQDPDAYRTYATSGRVSALNGKIGCKACPMLDDYIFVMENARDKSRVKANIPSPLQVLVELTRSRQSRVNEFYENWEQLADDVAEAYRRIVTDLYDAGCRCLQFDDCAWCYLCSPKWVQEHKRVSGMTFDETVTFMLDLTNRVTGFTPEDMLVMEHICCGPFNKEWNDFGGYAPIAEAVFPKLTFDAVHLKMDGGRMDVISAFPESVTVILGLVDAKSPQSEDEGRLRESLAAAGHYHPADKLAISTQCGFSSSESSITMPYEQQWEKCEMMCRVVKTLS